MSGATQLDLRVSGAGEPVLLVHGGVDRDRTWAAQWPLAQRWRLIEPARRGFPPSPAAERQDFAADALDLAALLADEPAHAVGFSYGGLGLALAAAAAPQHLLSLTLVEPALFALPGERPAVRDPAALIAVHFPGDPEREADFLAARAQAPPPRPPGEAQLDLAPIAAAGVPALVVSGDHHHAFEELCDAVAEQLGGERVALPGCGHAVPHAPGFNDALERFLRTSAPSADG
jgi:pimeloyl-ACP methyl ester carboxylesterase